MTDPVKASDRVAQAEYGRLLAQSARPMTDDQIEAAARLLAALERP